MSKSDPTDKGRICLTDSMDSIEMKIMKAKTDLIAEVFFGFKKFYLDRANRPELYNLAEIYMSVTQIGKKDLEEKFKNKSLKEFKIELTEVLLEEILPIGDRVIGFFNIRLRII